MDHWSEGYYPWRTVIWGIAVMVIVVVSALRKFLTERERQRTLRAALERGQSIDPQVLNNIVTKQSPRSVRGQLQTGGIITLSAGIGLALMGMFIIPHGAGRIDGYNPTLGPGIMVAVVGLGMLVASLFQPRSRDGSGPPDAGM